ncbi:MAG: PAS domain S-box protein [Candidatus Didemnitutus sp.]|nr:PAS domain S-box protein [Candidatus Didemnitutus sp.]
MELPTIILSVLLQATAFSLSLLLVIRLRRRVWPYFLAMVLGLMLARRLTSLIAILNEQQIADFVAESFAIAVSVVLLVILLFLLRWLRGLNAPDAIAPGNVAVTAVARLRRQAILLALAALLVTAVLAEFAYQASRDAISRRLASSSLTLAEMMRSAIEEAPSQEAALRMLDRLWREAVGPERDDFLCVVGPEGMLQLHTRRPQAIGRFVGQSRLPGNTGQPATVLELVRAKGTWSGRNHSFESMPQIVAYVYSEKVAGLLAVHLPAASVDKDLHAALLPWAIGFAVVFFGVLPICFLLLHRVAVRLQQEALESFRRKSESEGRYRAIVDAEPACVKLIARDGTLLEINPAGLQMIEAKAFAPLAGTAAVSLVVEEDRPTYRTFIEQVFRDGSGCCTYRLLSQTGRVRWLETHATVLRPAEAEDSTLLSISLDITARKAAERNAEAMRGQLNKVFERVTDAFVALDAQWCFTYVNPKAGQIFGREAASLIGKNIWMEFPEGVGQPFHQVYEEALRTQQPTVFEDYYPPIARWFVNYVYPSPDGLSIYFHDITERKRAEMALRASESRFRTLFEQAAVGVGEIATKTGCFLKVNERYCNIVGYASEEMHRLDFPSITHPADLPADRNNMQRLIRGEIREFSMEKRYIRKDGSFVWVLLTVSPLWEPGEEPTSHIAVVEDINERKLAEATLRESVDRLRLAVQASSVGLWDWELASNRVIYSREWMHQLGYEAHEISPVLSEWESRVHPDDHLTMTKRLRRYLTKPQGAHETEYRMRHKDGSWRWIYARGEVFHDADGNAVRMMGCHMDVTERKQVHDQSLRAQRMEAIGSLSAGIAHDLNNILAPVLMASGVLRTLPLAAQDLEMVAMIESSARRGAAIIRQLLTFSRGVEGERVAVQLQHLIQELVTLISETFPRNLTIVENASRDLRPVHADSTQLQQVLMNLCVNARDAMPQGGTLTIAAQNLVLAAGAPLPHVDAKPGNYVVARVRDTGTGIPIEFIERIFEPFYTTKELGKGTGLGLSTALGIVRSHGGFFTVESEQSHGTTFSIYLPAAEGTVLEAQANNELGARGNGETLLVVDDEASVLSTLRAGLEKHGYQVVTARDGHEALAMFKLHHPRIKMVITDLMMPGMDGAELVREIHKFAGKVPVIASSGLGDTSEFDAKHEGLIAEFLPKPYDFPTLFKTIRAHLVSETP